MQDIYITVDMSDVLYIHNHTIICIMIFSSLISKQSLVFGNKAR